MEMVSRLSISFILILAAVIWGGSLFLLNINLSWDHAKPFSITVAALTAILSIFNNYLWSWQPFNWFHDKPDLQGTWKVEIVSTYVDPKTKQKAEPIIGYAAIRQNFSSLSIRLMTEDSSSSLVAHGINVFPDKHVEVTGTYLSEPSIHLRGSESEIHYGAFKLTVSGNPPTLIEGHFWTDRNTKGKISYLERKKQIADHYEAAKILYA